MNWETFLDPTFSARLCLMLVHSLWQMTLLAVLVWGLHRLWRRRSVEKSYAMHVAALLAGLAAMPVTYALIDVTGRQAVQQSERGALRQSAATAHATPVVPQAPAPSEVTESRPRAMDTAALTVAPTVTTSVPATSAHVAADVSAAWQTAAAWTVALYALGVLAMLARLLRGLWYAHRLAAHASPLSDGPVAEQLQSLARHWSMRVTPALAVAERVIVPKVVGLLRPTILLPASAVSGLSPDELQMILAHELAHIRRHDLWVNLLQRLSETLLFFNPALWYLTRRISTLREYCCDELTCRTMAAAAAGDPPPSGDSRPPLAADSRTRYAAALLRVAELSRQSPPPSELATLAATGRSPSDLRRRIAHLFGEPLREPLRLSWGSVVALVAAAAALLSGPAVWQAKTDDAANNAGNRERFELLIVGPDKRPVSHASVEVRPRPKPDQWTVHTGTFIRPGTYGAFMKANQDGKLEFDLPDGQLRSLAMTITTDGFAPFWAEWDIADTSVPLPQRYTVHLDAGQSVGGIIVDEQGEPIARAVVHPSIKFKKREGDLGELHVGAWLKTDTEGRWSFHSVPAAMDELHVQVSHPEFMPLAKSISTKEFSLQKGQMAHVPLVMPSGMTVSGQVTDEDGNPIGGAIIRTKFVNDMREAVTNEDGFYELVGCPPVRTSLVATADGRAPDLKNIQIAEAMGPVNFALGPGNTIRVRVTDRKGDPIRRARIFFRSWRGDAHDDELGTVHEYTDANGIWEWNEAPSDPVVCSIYGPNQMEIPDATLVARAEEYVFVPPPALVVSGHVVDADSKKPIHEFRVVPGVRFTNGQLHWSRRDAFDSANGSYRIKHSGYRDAHLVRIEAAGFQPAVSRDIKADEGNVTIDFALRRGKNVEATVRTPDGSPAEGAEVALGLANSQIHIRNGEYTSSTFCDRAVTDDQGRFRFPPQEEVFQLIVLHPSGFANLKGEPSDPPATIALQPWARVDGTFRIGNEAAAEILIKTDGWQSLMDQNIPRSLLVYNEATTGRDGSFIFERVFPGEWRVGRKILFNVTQRGHNETISHTQFIELTAGETIEVPLAGRGRPIIGQLVPPADVDMDVDWKFSLVRLEPTVPLQKMSTYATTVNADGSFRFDDVPAGVYEFQASLWGTRGDGLAVVGRPISTLKQTIQARHLPSERLDEPIDMGILVLE